MSTELTAATIKQSTDGVEQEGKQSSIDTYLFLRRTHDMLARYIDGELGRHGTSVAQYGVLVNLCQMQPCSLTDLSTKLFRTSGNITSLIDRMEMDDLVERLNHPEDRRVTLVRLTPTGENMMRTLRPAHRVFLTNVMDCFSDDELAELTRLLDKLQQRLGMV